MNDRNITNARFIQVNQWPQIDSQLTAKLYVDDTLSNSVDESTWLRLDPDEKLKLDEKDSSILESTLTSPTTIIEIPTKAYFDGLNDGNEKNRRGSGLAFYDESNDLVKNNQHNDLNDNKLINLDSVTVNRDPASDNELSREKN